MPSNPSIHARARSRQPGESDRPWHNRQPSSCLAPLARFIRVSTEGEPIGPSRSRPAGTRLRARRTRPCAHDRASSRRAAARVVDGSTARSASIQTTQSGGTPTPAISRRWRPSISRRATSSFNETFGNTVKSRGRALNVNTLDEVPDSSWFTNRLGRARHDDRRGRARAESGGRSGAGHLARHRPARCRHHAEVHHQGRARRHLSDQARSGQRIPSCRHPSR